MSDKTKIRYELYAWDHDFNNSRTYQNHFEEHEYKLAKLELDECKEKYPNVKFYKETTEMLFVKSTEHKCVFTSTGYVQLAEDAIGKCYVDILKCECGEQSEGEKHYI